MAPCLAGSRALRKDGPKLRRKLSPPLGVAPTPHPRNRSLPGAGSLRPPARPGYAISTSQSSYGLPGPIQFLWGSEEKLHTTPLASYVCQIIGLSRRVFSRGDRRRPSILPRNKLIIRQRYLAKLRGRRGQRVKCGGIESWRSKKRFTLKRVLARIPNLR
jgi:hypothetical protein